jgi:glycosyltransferase involved in cell wall biosynthesis
MKVIFTIAGLSPEFGGPSESVPALAESIAGENVDVHVITCEPQPRHGAPRLPNPKLVQSHVVSRQARTTQWRARTNEFFHTLDRLIADKTTIIHDNGLWLPTNHATAVAARQHRRPLVISPRGMLTQWALRHHGLKKVLAWRLFQRRDLFNASALHATSDQEAATFRKVGFEGPIAVVPNGVEIPQRAKSEAERARNQELRTDNREQPRKRIALCVTRIHPVKGLMNLVEAWSEARPSGWRMIVAGSDEDRHQAELEAAVRRRGLNDAFEFVGAVDSEQKEALYNSADLFILPSHSENFGMSIAEGLAHGVPVITTRGTPWIDLLEHQCGWWAELGTGPLASALREAVSLSDQQRSEMGQRGRELVAQKYSWSRVAKEMKSVYQWLLGQADQPACVAQLS